MPSPIAHSTMGYVIYRRLRQRLPLSAQRKGLGPLPYLLILSVIFSMLPDLDAVFGIINNDFAGFHNNGTHSLFVGLIVSFIAAGLVWVKRRSDFLSWFLLFLLSYEFHVILDFFTRGGRGVMLFWPLTSERFASPIILFYGVRWSEGLFSLYHLITIFTELLFAGLLVGLEGLKFKELFLKKLYLDKFR